MDERAYTAWLGTLDDETRALVQQLMARVGALLNSDRQRMDREVARLERHDHDLAQRLSALNVRLDRYEQNRLDEVTAKLIEFADSQLPSEERDRLIKLLYTIGARTERLEHEVEQLKARAVNDNAGDQATSHKPG